MKMIINNILFISLFVWLGACQKEEEPNYKTDLFTLYDFPDTTFQIEALDMLRTEEGSYWLSAVYRASVENTAMRSFLLQTDREGRLLRRIDLSAKSLPISILQGNRQLIVNCQDSLGFQNVQKLGQARPRLQPQDPSLSLFFNLNTPKGKMIYLGEQKGWLSLDLGGDLYQSARIDRLDKDFSLLSSLQRYTATAIFSLSSTQFPAGTVADQEGIFYTVPHQGGISVIFSDRTEKTKPVLLSRPREMGLADMIYLEKGNYALLSSVAASNTIYLIPSLSMSSVMNDPAITDTDKFHLGRRRQDDPPQIPYLPDLINRPPKGTAVFTYSDFNTSQAVFLKKTEDKLLLIGTSLTQTILMYAFDLNTQNLLWKKEIGEHFPIELKALDYQKNEFSFWVNTSINLKLQRSGLIRMKIK
jgi:hypothetical protein